MDCKHMARHNVQRQTLIKGRCSYLRMTSTSTSSGGTLINYSERFTVTGLTGTTPPNIVKAVDGSTKGPATENNMVNGASPQNAAAGVVPADGDYGVPYNKQSGSIRYAPMQPFPPTKISKKGKPAPLYPTSAFTIATAKLPPPTVISTITESQTVHAMTMENTVCLSVGRPGSTSCNLGERISELEVEC